MVGNPSGIAVDRLGHVYIPLYWEDRILKLSNDGQTTLASLTNPELRRSPDGIAVDSDLNIYVPTTIVEDFGYVMKFDANGTHLYFSGTQLKSIGGIAVDDNIVYVVESWYSRVVKFNKSGSLIGTFGNSRTLGEFPQGIAVRNGSIYVAHETGVSIFDSSSEQLVRRYDSGRAWRIVVDSAGNMYVPGSTFIKISENGAISAMNVSNGNRPQHIAIDENDNLYMILTDGFVISNAPIDSSASPDLPEGSTSAATGHLIAWSWIGLAAVTVIASFASNM